MRIDFVKSFAGVLVGFCTFAVLNPGCDLADEDCNKGYRPYDCVTTSPDNGVVRVEVVIDAGNSSVPIVLYRGTVEQNQVVVIDTLKSVSKEYSLPNGDYSVRAQYRTIVNGNPSTVYSVDGGNLTFSTTEYCDGNCYSSGTLVLDAKYP